MALPTGPWQISKEDLEKMLATPPLQNSVIDQIISAERRYVEEGVRRALGLWVSELEPELMFRIGETRPFGLTARGHGTPYIEIKWDPNFYLTSEPIRYPIKRKD